MPSKLLQSLRILKISILRLIARTPGTCSGIRYYRMDLTSLRSQLEDGYQEQVMATQMRGFANLVEHLHRAPSLLEHEKVKVQVQDLGKSKI